MSYHTDRCFCILFDGPGTRPVPCDHCAMCVWVVETDLLLIDLERERQELTSTVQRLTDEVDDLDRTIERAVDDAVNELDIDRYVKEDDLADAIEEKVTELLDENVTIEEATRGAVRAMLAERAALVSRAELKLLQEQVDRLVLLRTQATAPWWRRLFTRQKEAAA